jgi:hypothetical protein
VSHKTTFDSQKKLWKRCKYHNNSIKILEISFTN